MHNPILRRAAKFAAAACVFSFVSSAFAAVDAFLYFKDSSGKETKVAISHDGTFKTSALKAGRYTWRLVCQPAGSHASIGRGIGSPTGSSADRESSTPSVSEMTVTKASITCSSSPRDQATGMATGRRMHKPMSVIKSLDRKSGSIILLSDPEDVVVVDADGDGISGTVQFLTKDGKTMAMDSWSGK